MFLNFEKLRDENETLDDLVDDEETLRFLDHLTDQLSYEGVTAFVKKLNHNDLTLSERIQYAIELILQDKKKKKDEVNEK